MTAVRAQWARWRALLGQHRWLLGILAAALVLRVATTIAYRPMLVEINDVWGYLNLSRDLDLRRHFVEAPDRPLGYPLALWLLARPGFHVGLVTALQHLAGLATGVLAYVVLLRFGVRRWMAVAAAAVVLLDCYAIALEQALMPEAFYTFALMASCVLVATQRSSRWPLVLAGLLLGAAAALRLSALVAIPAWALFLALRHWRRPGLLAAAAVALAIPLGAYVGAHASATGRIGFADASGFFLYGRVGHLADCRRMDVPPGTRALCPTPAERIDDPGFYIWDQQSPARRLLGGWGSTPEKQAANDALVGSFARATIRSRPLAYAGLVARDFSYFFTPGIKKWSFEGSLALPSSVDPDPGPLGESVWRGYRNHARYPAPLLNGLWHVLRTPRWLLAIGVLAALVSLALGLVGAVGRRPVPGFRRRETLLFAGVPLATLLVTAATAQFGIRYVVGVAPLLLVAGILAAEDLLSGTRWAHPRPPRALPVRAAGEVTVRPPAPVEHSHA